MNTTNNYYCNQKFWWLTIEPERKTMMSCCSAAANKIDMDWLKANPGELFNSPMLINERSQMLNGLPVASCESSCWAAERQGLPSRRVDMKSNEPTHLLLESTPEMLNINVGSDCNLTCSYCCKQYSTAWMRDVKNNGAYLDDERYAINNNDRLVLKLGQSIKESANYKLIIDEVKHYTQARVQISGGEPFLYNGLSDIVLAFPTANIITGLGVDPKRLERILDKLPDTVDFTVSAEGIGKLYEFNRYGNTWDRFLTNLSLIQKRFKYSFRSVISNLTIHGYQQFIQEFGTGNDAVNLCIDPDYLSAHVMDDASKELLTIFTDTVSVKYTNQQKENLKMYLIEFAKRRNLSLDVLPPTFVTWLKD